VKTQITGRHIDVSPSLKSYVTSRLSKLEKYIDGITDVHVTLSAEKYRQIAEINVHSRGKLYLSAKEGSDDLKTSVQQALEKIAGQAKKKQEKRIDRKRRAVKSAEAEGTFNVIAATGELAGTVRTLKPEVRDLVEARMNAIVAGIATAHGAEARLRYKRSYPVTRNHPEQTAFAAAVAGDIVGRDRVATDIPPIMGGEDFSYMLEARPGAFIFVGNGDTAALHNPAYDFNDAIIPIGCSYWVRLVETAMPAST